MFAALKKAASCVRRFSDIPSPKRLPLIGSTLSLIREGSSSKLHVYIDKQHKRYGPIFRDRIGPIEAIFVADPHLIQAVFRQEGKHPRHMQPDPWVVYNKKRGRTRGLFFMDGAEWLHYRRILNKLLLKSDNNRLVEESCTVAARDLIDRWRRTIADGDEVRLEGDLYRWSVNTLVALLVGPRDYDKLTRYEDLLARYATTVNLIFETTGKLLLIPAALAERFNTKAWRNFETVVDESLTLTNELVRALLSDFPDSDGLLTLLRREDVVGDDLIRIASDFVLAAGDTTAYTMEWLLYLLARNKEEQRVLRANVANPASAKNVIRETLRLYPVAPFLTRYLPEDCQIGDYHVPAGSLIVVSLYTSGRDDRFFADPNAFVPTRWTRDTSDAARLSAMQLASIPFAYGVRSCVGRKVAELQLQVTVRQLVQTFDIDLANDGEVDIALKMITVPSEPIRLRLKVIE